MKKWLFVIGFMGLVSAIWLMLPSPLFDEPWSTVVTDNQGRVVGVRVASDGQFRFEYDGEVPTRYFDALKAFEDRRFDRHAGVDFWALLRAMVSNVKAGRVVSGGSTITMQVVRMALGNPRRTYLEKAYEILLALRLEMSYSKEEILYLYVSHAPFGGNVVGVRAASYMYFGREPYDLSWAEAAFLAILPNAPSLRNGERLREKRDNLLRYMCSAGYFSSDDLEMALAEPLPYFERPDNLIPHLTSRVYKEGGGLCRSTIDSRLQARVNDIVARHSAMLSGSRIFNAAVLVAHIPTGEVRTYVGNSPVREGSAGNDVDIITAVRSSGSILKPALYAQMQQTGEILPSTLVSDVPVAINGYAPRNFSGRFLGAVPADKALIQSLNIPFVLMLREHGYARFHRDLQQMGIRTLTRPSDDYGLSLVLGGGEVALWDLCNMYAGMVSVMRHYRDCDGGYFTHEYERLHFRQGDSVVQQRVRAHQVPLNASAIYLTLKAMRQLERPDIESGWKHFASRIDLAWKTGTSFGFRDAWAVGVNAEWVVGVWVGNADGEGRPGLVGIRAAGPILFEVASLLPVHERLIVPTEEMVKVEVCRKSGHRASQYCAERDTVLCCPLNEHTSPCPYCRWVHLDKAGHCRVTSEVESIYNMKTVPWFVLPRIEEWYYMRTHTDYVPLPPYREDCKQQKEDMIDMIYPRRGVKVFIPRDFGGQKCEVVFEAMHRMPGATLYWHIDDAYRGTTQTIHQMKIDVSEGKHILTIVDNEGNAFRQTFEVVGK